MTIPALDTNTVRRWKRYPEYRTTGVTWFQLIPPAWECCELKFLLAANDGGVWGEDYDEEGTVVLRSTDMTFDGQWNLSNPARRRLSEKEIRSATLKRGDLVVTKSSGSELHLGKTALVTQEIEDQVCCFSNFMQRLRPNFKLNSSYLFWILNCPVGREQLNFNGSTTTGLANLGGRVIGETILPLPSLREQQAIAAFLDREMARIDALIGHKERLIALLEEKRQAVISHAVTRGFDPAAALKDSGVPWLGRVPAHWVLTRLQFVSEIQSGLTMGKNHGDQKLVERPYLRVANVQDGYLNLETITTVFLPEAEVSRYELQTGDVLMTEGGDFDKLGRGHVWDAQIPRCLHQNHVFAVRPNSTRILPHYLSAVTTSSIGRNYFTITSSQSTNLACTNATKLGNLPIPLPSIDEQNRILSTVEGETTRILRTLARIRDGIARLHEYRSALISAAVTGQIDVREEMSNHG